MKSASLQVLTQCSHK